MNFFEIVLIIVFELFLNIILILNKFQTSIIFKTQLHFLFIQNVLGVRKKIENFLKFLKISKNFKKIFKIVLNFIKFYF